MAGELCIAGIGLARGYINNTELTDEKFIDNPFEPGTKMYRTGDLARWYPRGDIEYLGRIDSQIKIRGFRVELGEIKSQIIANEGVDDSVITSVKDSSGNMTICAYIVPKTASGISVGALTYFLKGKLPDYMIPQSFVVMDKLPLLINGKVNYKALPKPEVETNINVDSVAPRNEMESEIFSAWCSVLGKSNFGVTDDFFSADVAGDSLRAIEVISALPRKNNAIIDITDFYQNPTIEELAQIYTSDDKDTDARKKRRSSYLLELSSNTKESTESDNISYICCPYGGGSAYVYAQLAHSLDEVHSRNNESVSVYSVNIPRMEFDTGERIFVELETVAERVMNEIRLNSKIRHSKIVVYAHCVGNGLGLKMLRRLENENYDVACMFAGAIFPPKFAKMIPEGYDPWKRFSDSSVLKHLLKIGLPSGDFDEATTTDLMKEFRFDVKEYYNYMRTRAQSTRNLVESPIISVVGSDDPMVNGYNRKYKRFGKYTYGRISIIVIDGAKHYFVKTHAGTLSQIIRNKLANDGFLGG
jgi:surfactin synthase thioesterase subunit/acyl carrier protein